MNGNLSESYSWLNSDLAIKEILHCTVEITQLDFASIVHIQEHTWTACAVHSKNDPPYKVDDTLVYDCYLKHNLRDEVRPFVMGSIIRQSFGSDNIINLQKEDRVLISIPIKCPKKNFIGILYAQASRQKKIFEDSMIRTLQVFSEMISLKIEMHQLEPAKADTIIASVKPLEIREQLVTILSHDLCTPIQAIEMGTHILLQRDQLAENREIVERIDRSAKRMGKLIDNILSFAHGQLGETIPANKVYCDFFSKNLKNVVDELRYLYPKRTVLGKIEDVGTVYCDIGQIAQLLSNLGNNALKYSPPDSIVDIAVAAGDHAITISVTNYGKPISNDVIPRLFKPYWRAAEDSASPGLGLGLYIVHEVVKAHGGGIDVRSTAETGTTFSVTIPRNSLSG
jgi:signal transduction histidine kinase